MGLKRAMLYIHPGCRRKMYKIHIKPSTIPGAGMGAYAAEDIPESAYGVYTGRWVPVIKKRLTTKDANPLYSWEVYSYSKRTGNPYTNHLKRACIGCLDADHPTMYNWAKYVNCGLDEDANNITCFQKARKIYYKTLRMIKKGEEMFIDYGIDYRRDHLHLKYSGDEDGELIA